VGGVVAEHEQVEQAAAGHLRHERPLVARHAEGAHLAALPGLAAILQRPAGTDDLPPLRRLLDVVERQHIDVIGAQLAQDARQLGMGVGGGTGLELHADHHLAAARAEGGYRFAQAVGVAAPVEEVDAAVQREVNVGGGESVGAARGQAEAAQRPVEGEVRAAEGGEQHGVRPVLLRSWYSVLIHGAGGGVWLVAGSCRVSGGRLGEALGASRWLGRA
jgi:hypothetical protein